MPLALPRPRLWTCLALANATKRPSAFRRHFHTSTGLLQFSVAVRRARRQKQFWSWLLPGTRVQTRNNHAQASTLSNLHAHIHTHTRTHAHTHTRTHAHTHTHAHRERERGKSHHRERERERKNHTSRHTTPHHNTTQHKHWAPSSFLLGLFKHLFGDNLIESLLGRCFKRAAQEQLGA